MASLLRLGRKVGGSITTAARRIDLKRLVDGLPGLTTAQRAARKAKIDALPSKSVDDVFGLVGKTSTEQVSFFRRLKDVATVKNLVGATAVGIIVDRLFTGMDYGIISIANNEDNTRIIVTCAEDLDLNIGDFVKISDSNVVPTIDSDVGRVVVAVNDIGTAFELDNTFLTTDPKRLLEECDVTSNGDATCGNVNIKVSLGGAIGSLTAEVIEEIAEVTEDVVEKAVPAGWDPRTWAIWSWLKWVFLGFIILIVFTILYKLYKLI
jgi:hypothetical protein